MAECGVHLEEEKFKCPVCLDLLKDPVAVPCGHSYCMDCIKNCWDAEDHIGVYRCPQCRHTFTSRPVLGRNTILAEVVDKLKRAEVQTVLPEHCFAGPGDVVCDVCTGRKRKAVKSCLVCLVSHCETHLSLHEKLNPAKRHRMIDATKQLKEKVCSKHEKLLEVYCRTDEQCICYQCVMDEHRGHDVVSAASGRTEKEKPLQVKQSEFLQRIQRREKEVQQLRQAMDSITHSAQAAVEDTESIFKEMTHFLEKRCFEVIEGIRAQEKAASGPAQGLLEQLEQEIDELKRRQSELEQLSHTEDHIHFLQSFQSVCVPPELEHLPTITVNLHFSFGDVKKALSDVRVQLEEACKDKITVISQTVKEEEITEPRTREEFLCYACQLTLDINTANKFLRLSERNMVVTCEEHLQSYPDHPERFEPWNQVLCTQGLSGLCYWELQWSGDGGVYVVVSYKGIDRKEGGTDSIFGNNNKSWTLFCSPFSYCFYHNNLNIPVCGPISSTIGVYLDHTAGTLSFYSVSGDTMTLLHRVQTTFTEPLYPGFYVNVGCTVKLCSLQ